MFTRPPELSDETVALVVAEAWGVDASSVEYVAVGFGSHHWNVLDVAGGRWFATVDDLPAKRNETTEPIEHAYRRLDAALSTARRLRDLGLDFVVAPMPTARRGVLAPIDRRFVAALYPWIDGRSHGYGTYENPADRDDVLHLLSRLHSVEPSAVPEARREDFAVPNRAGLVAALGETDRPWETGPYGEPARRLLLERADQVRSLLDRFDMLAVLGAERHDRFVVTHGEPHPANTLESADGRMLIDWDTTLVAPPERDLWMVLETGASTTPASYAPTRSVEVSGELLHLYRLHWDLMEIAGYVSFFRSTHSDSADAAESWKNLNAYIDTSGLWSTT